LNWQIGALEYDQGPEIELKKGEIEMTVRWQGRHHFDTLHADHYEGLGILEAPGQDFFVSTLRGNDNRAGVAWAEPKATIQGAVVLAATARYRGRGLIRIFVESGGYDEAIVTPTNALCPFGALIGVNNNGFGFGPYLTSPTAGGAILTVRARGWHIEGFEFDLPTTGKGIVLDGHTALMSGNYTRIRKCLFNGQKNSTFGIDFYDQCNFVTIEDNIFYDIYNAGGTAQAIACTNSDSDTPNWAKVLQNWFANNDKHLSLNGLRGFKNGRIKYNDFIKTGNLKTATVLIDLTGGSNNIVAENYSDQAWDDIDSTLLKAGTNDIWGPNHCPEGVKYGDPT